jgi:dinuclear metal center YbgI/SA1388 family protein
VPNAVLGVGFSTQICDCPTLGMATARELAAYLDGVLGTDQGPDYPLALNGLQLDSEHAVRGLAAAVDFSTTTIQGTSTKGANFLIVHHGMFWSGIQPITGAPYRGLARLISEGIAVYSSHLPLDRHPVYGNNALLAAALGLTPDGSFADYQAMPIGVAGGSDIETMHLVKRIEEFCAQWGGAVRTSPIATGRQTRRWAICTGAGASADTLHEAEVKGIDTLIVGEGPYWTSIAASEQNLAIVYAGHYATETLGVRAITKHLSEKFALPWTFVDVPSAL